jgi:uncharacterized membrane protein
MVSSQSRSRFLSSIAQPSGFGHLAHQLVQRWPSLAAYVVSFTVIGIMWVNHHTIFTHLRVVNKGLFYFNLLLLMTIAFIPYPTEVFGEALSRSQGAPQPLLCSTARP